jgi:transposase
MNVRLHRAVSDVDGATGMAIVRAIADGERDPRQLARLRDRGCRSSEEEIAEQLNGHWREDHLFSLRQSLQMYDAIGQRIADYDREILSLLNSMTPDPSSVSGYLESHLNPSRYHSTMRGENHPI